MPEMKHDSHVEVVFFRGGREVPVIGVSEDAFKLSRILSRRCF